jgi:hypothetical protein
MEAAVMKELSHEELLRLLSYDPLTGIFIWRVRSNRRFQIGAVAGCIGGQGYRVITIYGRIYGANRLAWFYMKGEWPPDKIDHASRKRDDDSWKNLRSATHKQNCRNSLYSRNKLGLKGVRLHHGAYESSIQTGRRAKYLGSFDCPAAASFAYQIAADKEYGEFARPF